MYSGTVQVHVLVLLEIESRLIKALNIAGKRWSDQSIKDKLGNRGVYFPACRSLDNGLDFELKILSNLLNMQAGSYFTKTLNKYLHFNDNCFSSKVHFFL